MIIKYHVLKTYSASYEKKVVEVFHLDIKEVLNVISDRKVKEIALQFTDLSGTLHTLWIPSQSFEEVSDKGIHTDGSSLGVVDVSKSDVKLLPDIDNYIWFYYIGIPEAYRENETIRTIEELLANGEKVCIFSSIYNLPEETTIIERINLQFHLAIINETYFERFDSAFYAIS